MTERERLDLAKEIAAVMHADVTVALSGKDLITRKDIREAFVQSDRSLASPSIALTIEFK